MQETWPVQYYQYRVLFCLLADTDTQTQLIFLASKMNWLQKESSLVITIWWTLIRNLRRLHRTPNPFQRISTIVHNTLQSLQILHCLLIVHWTPIINHFNKWLGTIQTHTVIPAMFHSPHVIIRLYRWLLPIRDILCHPPVIILLHLWRIRVPIRHILRHPVQAEIRRALPTTMPLLPRSEHRYREGKEAVVFLQGLRLKQEICHTLPTTKTLLPRSDHRHRGGKEAVVFLQRLKRLCPRTLRPRMQVTFQAVMCLLLRQFISTILFQERTILVEYKDEQWFESFGNSLVLCTQKMNMRIIIFVFHTCFWLYYMILQM